METLVNTRRKVKEKCPSYVAYENEYHVYVCYQNMDEVAVLTGDL